jgi:hypothetical protein
MGYTATAEPSRRRVAACEEAGSTWQKIVNYACATEEDNTELLEAMGVNSKPRRAGSSNVTGLQIPDLTIVNLAPPSSHPFLHEEKVGTPEQCCCHLR